MAIIFLDNWIVPFGIPKFVLADYGPQCVSKFSAILCADLGVKQLSITGYHPQISDQAMRFNRAVVTRVLRCVADGQKY